jgi:hypothetical protein
MSALDSTPSNKSFLSPIGFRFTMQRLPHVNYFCTQASIPAITLAQISVPMPMVNKHYPADKLEFDELSITFRIDEDLQNYSEIYDWMHTIASPEGLTDRTANRRTQQSVSNVFSDGSLIVTTAAYKPNIEIKFNDLFPTTLSTLSFNVEETEITYLQAEASFKYRNYELIRL